MLNKIKQIFGTKPKRRIEGINLIYPPKTNIEKYHIATLVIYLTLVDLKVLEESESTYREFSETFYDCIHNKEAQMLNYFEQIKILDENYFNDIQVQEAMQVWKMMNLLVPIDNEYVDSKEYMFAVRVIYDTLVEKNFIHKTEEAHLRLCKAIVTPSTGDIKYPLLESLIGLPGASEKGTKINKALKIYVRIQDEQQKINHDFEMDNKYAIN